MKKTLTVIIIGLLCFSMFPILAPRTEAETSKWIVKTPLPRPQALFGVAVANGRIFAIGGQYQSGGPTPAWSDSNYEYDPLIDSWSSKAAMPTKRTTLAAISVNNKIYAIGGAASTSGGAYSVNEEFDPISNSWTTRAPMPTSRNWISAAAVNGKIYVIGGSDNSGGIFSMNEMYDPLTDTWTTKKPDPQARLACGIGVVNGKIYLIGGWVRPGAPPGEPTTLTEEYDPQTDTWTTKAPMPTARNGLAVTVMNNRIYAIGGATDFNPWTNNLNVVEAYDPSTDTWTAVQSMPTPRSLLGAAVAGNKILAIGGWGITGYLDTNEEFSIGALVGYWKFDEGSGSVAFDSSGNNHDGAVNGAEWTNGVSNGALYFDGSDYVAVPDNPSLSGFTQLTLEVWIKPDRFDSYLKGIVNKGNGGGYFGDEYGLQLNYDKVRLILSAGSPTGWIVVADTDPIISLNQWYHVAGVWDSTNYYIYVNGQLAKSGQTIVSGASIHDTSNSLNIGGIATGSWLFNGAIDEVKIYNYARTAGEIQNDYNSVLPPVGQKPVAILHLDDTVHNVGADVWFYGDQSYDPDGGKITSYIFDFDDGTPNQQVYWPNIGTIHQYIASGEYFPRMKVLDDEGTESDGVSETLTILPAPGFPTAILTAYPNPQKVSNPVTFDASQSSDPDGISDYGFDFGDGTPIAWTSNPIVTHSYPQVGEYYARVCVSDNTGLETWSLKQRITIRNEEPPQPTTLRVTIQSDPPVRVGTIPFAVTFTATPSGGKGSYSIVWLVKSSIGGTWSSTENPLTFNFKYSDTYVVKATATCSGSSEVATAQTTIIATGAIYEAKFTLWSGIVQAGTNNPLVSLEYNNVQNLGYFTVSGSSVSLKTGVRVSFNGAGSLPDWLFDLIGISAPWYSIKVSDAAGTVDAVPLVQLKAGTATPIDVTLPLGTPTTIDWGYMYNFSASPTSGRAVCADLVSCVFAALGLKVEGEAIRETVFMAIVQHLDETMGAQLIGLPFMSTADQLSLIQTVINDVLTPDYLISVAAAVGGDLGRSLMTKALQKEIAAATVLSDLALFFGAIFRGDLWDQYYVSQATPMLYMCIDPPEIMNAVLNTPYGAVGYRDGVWVNEGSLSGFYHSEILNKTYGFGIPITASEYYADLTISSPSGNAIPYSIIINWMNNTSVSQGDIAGMPQTFGIEVFETGKMTAVAWEYIFKDAKHGTTLKISTDDKYFQFIASSKDFGIKYDPKMIVYRNTIIICYSDKKMSIAAIATTGKTKICVAIVLDKQTRRLYLLISPS